MVQPSPTRSGQGLRVRLLTVDDIVGGDLCSQNCCLHDGPTELTGSLNVLLIILGRLISFDSHVLHSSLYAAHSN